MLARGLTGLKEAVRTKEIYEQSKGVLLNENSSDIQKQITAIENSIDFELEVDRTEKGVDRIFLVGGSSISSAIPVLGQAASELFNSYKDEFGYVDEGEYGRQKTAAIMKYVDEYEKNNNIELDPSKTLEMLEKVLNGLKVSRNAYQQLDLEFSKNLGRLILDHKDEINFRFDKIEALLHLDASGRQEIKELIEKYHKDYQFQGSEANELLDRVIRGVTEIQDNQISMQVDLMENLVGLLSDHQGEANTNFEAIKAFLGRSAVNHNKEKEEAFEAALLKAGYDGARSGFGLLATIGAQFKLPDLAKLGQAGSLSVDIFQAANSLKSMASVVSLASIGSAVALLTPVSAIAVGIFSLVSLLGSSKQSETGVILKALQAVSTQLREFRLEAKKKLAEIDSHVLDFADSMTRHYLILMEKMAVGEEQLRSFIKDRFNLIEASISDLDRNQDEIGRAVLSKDVRTLVHGMKHEGQDSQFFKKMLVGDYYKHVHELTFWMGSADNHGIHNGSLRINPAVNQENLALNFLANRDAYEYLSVLLSCLNVQFNQARSHGLSLISSNFNEVKVVNPFVWLYVTEAYVKLMINVPQYFQVNEEVRRNSVGEADKVIDVIRRLKTESRIYTLLFELYSTVLNKMKNILLEEKSRIKSRARVDIFEDIDFQVNHYSGNLHLPASGRTKETLGLGLEIDSIDISSFNENIRHHIPSLVVLLCDLGFGRVQVDVSFRDGKVGCYGMHLRHLSGSRAKEAKKNELLAYSIDGFGEIKDYLYYERIFDFSIKFVPVESQTREIHVANISLSTLVTHDRRGEGHDFHEGSDRVKDLGRRYEVFVNRIKRHVFNTESKSDQLNMSVASNVRRFVKHENIQAGLLECRSIFDRQIESEKQSFVSVIENKAQDPGMSINRYINQLRTLEIVFNSSLSVANIPEEVIAIRAPVSLFFSQVPSWRSFQKLPSSHLKPIMTSSFLGSSVGNVGATSRFFENEFIKEINVPHPLEVALNERVEDLVLLPRLVGNQ